MEQPTAGTPWPSSAPHTAEGTPVRTTGENTKEGVVHQPVIATACSETQVRRLSFFTSIAARFLTKKRFREYQPRSGLVFPFLIFQFSFCFSFILFHFLLFSFIFFHFLSLSFIFLHVLSFSIFFLFLFPFLSFSFIFFHFLFLFLFLFSSFLTFLVFFCFLKICFCVFVVFLVVFS